MRPHFLKPLPLLAITTLLLSALQIYSQEVISFKQPMSGGGSGGPNSVQGWEFRPTTDVTVLSLGLYDGRHGAGFNEAHEVGIWRGGSLIASALLPAGQSGVQQNEFRFVDITPTPLTHGQTYVIGALMPAPASDFTVLFWPRDLALEQNVSVDPRIDLTAYRWSSSSPNSLIFPQSRDASYVGAFGPNFILAVPEPSTLSLMVGTLAFAVRCGLRKKGSTHSLGRF